MFIQTEDTPNPSTIKFLPGMTIVESGVYEFKAGEDMTASPLAQRLYGIPGVVRILLAQDYVSVSKDDSTDWIMLKPMILAALMEHLSTGQPILDERVVAASDTTDGDQGPLDELSQQIVELIDTRVRPAVAADGGDIVFDRFEEGVVYLEMRGACSGCPSSTATLKSGIENMLKHYVPEVMEVRALS